MQTKYQSKVGQQKLVNRHSMIEIEIGPELTPKQKSTWKEINAVLGHLFGSGMQLSGLTVM